MKNSIPANGTTLSLKLDKMCIFNASDAVSRYVYTLFLFTYSDFKTIFFPIVTFSAVAAPVYCLRNFICGMFWIWLHLLQCNVSNQYKTRAEDIVNKPWRPLCSGRVTLKQAAALRWTLVVLCAFVSYLWGIDVMTVSLWLTATMIIHDEFRLAGHWLGKNICNVSGYVSFELGATKIMGRSASLDGVATLSVILSSLIIFTTIHMQDFEDVLGDHAIGRVTIPIRFPKASRLFSSSAMIVWSIVLSYIWRLTFIPTSLLCAVGAWIAYRTWMFRSAEEDKKTYIVYNLWLVTAHCLPINARLPEIFALLSQEGFWR